MKKAIFNIIAYTLTALAVIIFLGEPNDTCTLLEVILWKSAAVAWFIGCYIYDGRKTADKQIFIHKND